MIHHYIMTYDTPAIENTKRFKFFVVLQHLTWHQSQRFYKICHGHVLKIDIQLLFFRILSSPTSRFSLEFGISLF